MSNISRCYLLLILPILLAGCKKDDPVLVDLPERLASLYYFGVGSSWTYESSEDSSSHIINLISQDPNTVLEVYEDGRVGVPQPGLLSQPAVKCHLQHSDSTYEYFQNLALGVAPNYTETWTLYFDFLDHPDNDGISGPSLSPLLVYYTSTDGFFEPDSDVSLSVEQLDLPAGTFEAFHIDVSNAELDVWAANPPDERREITRIYVVPEIGIVQYDIHVRLFDSQGSLTERDFSWLLSAYEVN